MSVHKQNLEELALKISLLISKNINAPEEMTPKEYHSLRQYQSQYARYQRIERAKERRKFNFQKIRKYNEGFVR